MYALSNKGTGKVCCVKGYEEGLQVVMQEVDVVSVEIGELVERTLRKIT